MEPVTLRSVFLKRNVLVDFYLPTSIDKPESPDLLLINDGQDLVTMDFKNMLSQLIRDNQLSPLIAVGIHCGEDRKNEYGMVSSMDFKGRGSRAGLYQQFILTELLPFIHTTYTISSFRQKSFAGFSLGGLSALDIVWNNHKIFSKVGVFSGSLWWRSKDKADKDFHESTDRLMHRQIRSTPFVPSLQFFFQCGELDELEDRNNNGVIDSIDDTIDLLRELLAKGYKEGVDFNYLQLQSGKHDVATWASAFPTFLKWGWGSKNEK